MFGNKQLKLRIIELESEVRTLNKSNDKLIKIGEDQMHIINCQQNRIDFLEHYYHKMYSKVAGIGKEGNDLFANYIANADEIDWSIKQEDGYGNISYPMKTHAGEF